MHADGDASNRDRLTPEQRINVRRIIREIRDLIDRMDILKRRRESATELCGPEGTWDCQ